MKNRKIFALTLSLALLGAAGCRKQLDINQNPNVATSVTPSLLLPAAQLELGSGLGVELNNEGSFFVEYWTQNPSASQFISLNRYQPNASVYDRPWSLLYTGTLTDLDQMYQQAAKNNLKQYQAISLILKAYTFQLITDGWGDVPYSEALKGLPEQGGILNPHYDAQEAIYDGIIQTTKDGMALIDANDPLGPAADDLVYGGDMSEWEIFGNTLLLKMYMRLSERNPTKAQAGIAALYANGIGFLGEGEDAQIIYSSTAGNQNPLSSETRRLGQNQIASATSGDSLNSNADPRRPKFYNTTTIVGARQGQTVATPGATYSIPNITTGANAATTAATAPVNLLMSYESLFLQAEAIARGWGTGSVADTLFKNGVRVNFRYLGLTTAQANTYLASAYWGNYPSGGTQVQKIRHIVTQKWFSMNGTQGFEAWTEWRRTGYPDFLVPAEGNATGDKFPARFFYPDNEFSRNSNFPGQKLITDRVWWDIN